MYIIRCLLVNTLLPIEFRQSIVLNPPTKQFPLIPLQEVRDSGACRCEMRSKYHRTLDITRMVKYAQNRDPIVIDEIEQDIWC